MTEGPSSFAVEVEPAQVRRGPGRRHRWVTVPSGVLLFVCLFLPAERGCGSTVYAFQLPHLATPYLLGALVAILALVRSPRLRRWLVRSIQVLAWATFLVGSLYLVPAVIHEPIVIVPFVTWLAVAALVLILYGRDADGEDAAARVTFASAILSMIWFGLWCLYPQAAWGVYASAGAAVGLFIGGIAWRRELEHEQSASRGEMKIAQRAGSSTAGKVCTSVM